MTAFSHQRDGFDRLLLKSTEPFFKFSHKEALHRRKTTLKPAIILNSSKEIHNASICKIPTHLSKVWSAFLFNSSSVPFRVAVGQDTMPFKSWIQCFRLNKYIVTHAQSISNWEHKNCGNLVGVCVHGWKACHFAFKEQHKTSILAQILNFIFIKDSSNSFVWNAKTFFIYICHCSGLGEEGDIR